MRQVASFLLLTLAACAYAPPVAPPPPVVAPPPPVVAPPPPTTVTDALSRIVIGSTVDEANAAVRRAASILPPASTGLREARWTLTDAAGTWMIVAVLDAHGTIRAKRATTVETIP